MQVHVVWIPKCRKKVLYGQLRRELGPPTSEVGIAKRERSDRRKAESGSCSRGAVDSAKVLGYRKWLVIWRARVRSGLQGRRGIGILWSELWARAYYVFNGWLTRDRPGICPQPGRGWWEIRPNENVWVNATFRWLTIFKSALSGSRFYQPPALRGDDWNKQKRKAICSCLCPP